MNGAPGTRNNNSRSFGDDNKKGNCNRLPRTVVNRFWNYQTDSFASPSSTRCSNFGGVPGCHSFAQCDTR